MLWIWQLKSNNVADLNSKIWDQWANIGTHPDQEIGSIGQAYGAQLGKKSIYPNGEFDQVDRLLYDLKNNPASRRIVTEIFNHQDLHLMNLAPCVHQITFSVKNGKLNMMLNQRSNDTLAAGNWNVVQYATLLTMLAKVSNLEVGEMCHMVVDAHIYDRHVPMVIEIMFNRMNLIQKRLFTNETKKAIEQIDNASVGECAKIIKYCIMKESVENSFEKSADAVRYLQRQSNLDYPSILNEIKNTSTYQNSKRIIETMLAEPRFEKVLGFSSPKLVLDPNVDNFYDFKSPRMRTGKALTVENGQLVREGKFVDNPESSFNMEDYNPEVEGQELSMRVPIAE